MIAAYRPVAWALTCAGILFDLTPQPPQLPNLPRQYPREQMPMAVLFVLVAMAHQRDIAATAELLDKSQSELLTVILDALVGLIKGNATAKELAPIPAREIGPSHRPGPILQEKPFTRPKIRHPLVIPRLIKTPPAYSRC